jgi:hypothetical protein
MSCIKEELIQKYIDKEASFDEVSYIENHLISCSKCTSHVEYRRKLSVNIKSVLFQNAELIKDIPEFIPPKIENKRHIITWERILFDLSAACIAILIFYLINNNNPEGQPQVMIINRIGANVDANLPVTQQEMIFQVVDPQGNISEMDIN